MSDNSLARDMKDPGWAHIPVTPADDTYLEFNSKDQACRALLVAVAGDIEITQMDDVKRVITVPAGYFLNRVKIVHATNTTASGISAVY